MTQLDLFDRGARPRSPRRPPAESVAEATIHLDETPWMRLQAHGARALGDSELVAAIVSPGARRSVASLPAARALLKDTQGLRLLATGEPPATATKHLGRGRAATLSATLELARRLARCAVDERAPLSHPAAVASYLALRYSVPDQEVMGALYLDARQRLLAENELYRGTLLRAAAEPRQVLKEGLLHGAAGCILFHTHPSGDPSPSAEDLAFTRRMAEAGEVVGIRLVDHLVLGGMGRWVSLRERGAW